MVKTVASGFEWEIKNVLSISSLESDEFVLYESRWRLRLRVDRRYVNIDLNKVNAEKLNRGYKIRSFIEDRNEEIVKTHCHVLDNPDFATKEIWYITRDELQKQSDTYLTDGNLTFVIIFRSRDILQKDGIAQKGSAKSIQTSVNVDTVANLENLSLDFNRLLEDGVQTDVTLKCGESFFPAHRAVLSVRSEVFAAMFRSDMAESRTGVIQISDVDASVLDQFLHYIYSGQLSDLSVDTAPKLYAAADKYSVEPLKQFCAKFMTENLTRENACKILVFADTHGDKYLKDCALRFITNVELLRNKDMWDEFHNGHPKLAGEAAYHAYETKCLSEVN